MTDAREEGRLLIAGRRSKPNPDDEAADVRFVKGDVARALWALRERRRAVDPTERVVGLSAQAISDRFAAAAWGAGARRRREIADQGLESGWFSRSGGSDGGST